jgi:hypothetical protein
MTRGSPRPRLRARRLRLANCTHYSDGCFMWLVVCPDTVARLSAEDLGLEEIAELLADNVAVSDALALRCPQGPRGCGVSPLLSDFPGQLEGFHGSSRGSPANGVVRLRHVLASMPRHGTEKQTAWGGASCC